MPYDIELINLIFDFQTLFICLLWLVSAVMSASIKKSAIETKDFDLDLKHLELTATDLEEQNVKEKAMKVNTLDLLAEVVDSDIADTLKALRCRQRKCH